MLSKKAIWAIVIIMGTALVGIMLIQSYWINWSVQLNREKFDKDVFEALNKVAERLERREQDQALELAQSGYISEPYYSGYEQFEGHGSNSEQKTMSESKSSLESSLLQMSTRPFAERLDLTAIDVYLEQELVNRGIHIAYNYGVVSASSKNYVIMDGHYVFDESLTEVSNTGINRSLDNTPYRVDLFRGADKLNAPGTLLVFFPQLGKKVWESVWQMLAGSFIFTMLILLCFAYTIQIIFRQKKLSEMKTDFINNMTHEFKTPIATISLASDSITSPMVLQSPEKIERFAKIIKQENARMLNQVEKVLQMAMLDKGQIKLNVSPVDIHDIIRQASEHNALQIEKRDGHLTCSLDAEKHIIQGDSNHITNMIYNLLDNANKYSPTEPTVHISTRNKGKYIEVCISDKGIGMDKDELKFIYDKFYRVHTGNLHDVKGFGLGLSYVKTMMEAHRGKVEVKSEPGKGSSFFLLFPLDSNPL